MSQYDPGPVPRSHHVIYVLRVEHSKVVTLIGPGMEHSAQRQCQRQPCINHLDAFQLTRLSQCCFLSKNCRTPGEKQP